MFKFTLIIGLVVFGETVALKNDHYEAVKALIGIYRSQISDTLLDLNNKLTKLQDQLEEYSIKFIKESTDDFKPEFDRILADFGVLKQNISEIGGDALQCLDVTESGITGLMEEFVKSTNFCVTLQKDQNFANYINNIKSEKDLSLRGSLKTFENQLEQCGEENNTCLIALHEHLLEVVNKIHPGYFDKVVIDAEDKLASYEQMIYTGCYYVGKDIRYGDEMLKSIRECIEEISKL